MKFISRLVSYADAAIQHNITCISGRRFYRNYAKDLYTDQNFTSNIHTETAYGYKKFSVKNSQAFISRQIDGAIEQILDKSTYSPEHFLLIKDAYDAAPLTALLICNTSSDVTLSVTVLDDFAWHYEEKNPGKRHRIPIFGLQSGCRNNVRLDVLENNHVIFSQTFYIRTAPLPDMLTHMISVRKHTAKSASPLTFVFGGDTKLPYAFDETGKIRYYMTRRPKSYGLLPLSKGRFLFLGKTMCRPSFANPHAVLALEIDYLGRCYHEYYVPDGIHHDAGEMVPGGNILAASEHSVEDAVIEIDRNTGKIVKKLALQDLLSEHPYFDFYDWAHINTVSYHAKDHAVLVCARNLHSVIKIDWKTDKILWILCDTEFWKGTPYEALVLKPKSNTPFCYQPHAAYFMESATNGSHKKLLIFDNHWNARRTIKSFDNDIHSHVRIYDINEKEHTVTLSENYPCAKSKIRSNAITRKKRLFAMCGYLNKDIQDHSGSIIEFNRKNGRIVNRYLTYNSFYRAYPMKTYANALSAPLKDEDSVPYLTLSGGEPLRGIALDTENAKSLPRRTPLIKKQTKKGKTPQRKVDKHQKMQENRANPITHDIQNELSQLAIQFYDRLLLIGCRDHLISHVYLKSNENTYEKDFSQTEQKCDALFGNMEYFSTIPVQNIEPGTYEIYVRCEDVLYNTGRTFTKLS